MHAPDAVRRDAKPAFLAVFPRYTQYRTAPEPIDPIVIHEPPVEPPSTTRHAVSMARMSPNDLADRLDERRLFAWTAHLVSLRRTVLAEHPACLPL